MTVAELIEKLREFPPHLSVVEEYDGTYQELRVELVRLGDEPYELHYTKPELVASLTPEFVVL
jgi:hypothetical protein